MQATQSDPYVVAVIIHHVNEVDKDINYINEFIYLYKNILYQYKEIVNIC